jgi:hypothetical protein
MDADVSSDQNLIFHYKLFLADGRMIEFAIEIDPATETFISPIHNTPPFWTELDYQQCENCPLSKAQTPYCPVAVNLVPLIDLCGTLTSYEPVKVEVVTLERSVIGDTTLQRALSSILGLIMATSACPHTEYFKPMAHFHLPLASPDETVYRTSSMFLLAQYFLHKDGLNGTLELDKLTDIYKEIQVINRALARRFRAAISKDATVNAIVLLDLLSQSVTWSIEDGLEHLRYLFKRYGVR